MSITCTHKMKPVGPHRPYGKTQCYCGRVGWCAHLAQFKGLGSHKTECGHELVAAQAGLSCSGES